ncbi:hypothetical protein AUEXF2481DRAFT_510828 [Aureobasidium subglaciale EXF-2481]|uniref:Phosphoglycerate mutase-like protein n=1 Tax=Aureobasidium subglaciale (strain EXF-2481) TaxID=1043005 RepID=A0A074Y050_AURSE|nr:uncharacterized protein AUEXF2481DRAFT_510828 [Aureobasidium subglaciale EXF-2481]KEQ91143.1 hypothetical protein AUEXF2481DRAFT_510828 [Aureobasidium subglaciale EXF-2481]
MSPTVILIRHGQALHNINQEWEIPDPELSELGQQQCRTLEQHLRQHLPLADKVERIITSPMRRTLETTTLGLDWLIKRGIPVEASALWQENSNKPCDSGSPLSSVTHDFPSFDYSHVDPLWPSKTGPFAFTRTATVSRGQSCLHDLYTSKEKVIAVVSHAGFLRCAVSLCKYSNADYRIFDFKESDGEGDLELVEVIFLVSRLRKLRSSWVDRLMGRLLRRFLGRSRKYMVEQG